MDGIGVRVIGSCSACTTCFGNVLPLGQGRAGLEAMIKETVFFEGIGPGGVYLRRADKLSHKKAVMETSSF